MYVLIGHHIDDYAYSMFGPQWQYKPVKPEVIYATNDKEEAMKAQAWIDSLPTDKSYDYTLVEVKESDGAFTPPKID